jgi:hypothetical protein
VAASLSISHSTLSGTRRRISIQRSKVKRLSFCEPLKLQ